jgi:hypothetical protein
MRLLVLTVTVTSAVQLFTLCAVLTFYYYITTMQPANSNESYCTFTLASDVTAGGLPSEEEIAKDLESSDANVRCFQSFCRENGVGIEWGCYGLAAYKTCCLL